MARPRILFVSFFERFGTQKHGAVARIRGLVQTFEACGDVKVLELSGKGMKKPLLPRNFARLVSAWFAVLFKRYDVAVVSFPYLLPLFVLAGKASRTPVLYDSHNVEAERMVEIHRPRAARFLAWWEPLGVRGSAAVLAVSEEDAAVFRRQARDASRVFVVPNGVSSERFHAGLPNPWPALVGEKPVLFFFGDGDYVPNAEANAFILKEVAPRFLDHPKRPVFAITGSHREPPGWRAENVYATGKVPEIEPYVVGASAILVPIKKTAGTHLKTVESLAAGQVVLTTPEGATGLGLQHEKDAYIVPRERFPEAVQDILARLPAKEMREAARATAIRFDWKTIQATVAEAVQRALAAKRAS